MRSNELLTIIRRERPTTKMDGFRVSRSTALILSILIKTIHSSIQDLSHSIIYLDFFRSIHQASKKISEI